MQHYANDARINVTNVMATQAFLSFVANNLPKGCTAQLYMKKATDADWKEIPYTDKNNIPISGLSMKTQYQLRLALTYAGETSYSATNTFTTQSFMLNYDRFFEGSAKLHDNGNALFSMEGAHYTIYGWGFSNETSIPITLTLIDNPDDQLTLNSTILNDSMLSFDIPANLIPNSPYLPRKVYNCSVGTAPIISYTAYLSKNYELLADFTVMNRNVAIQSFSTDPYTCKTMTFKGYFATHETATVCPEFFGNLSLWTIQKALIIRSGSSIVKTILLIPEGTLACDANGLALADAAALGKSLLQYHEVAALDIKTTLASGSYTAQLRQTMKDGTVIYSNEFSFSF
ncbi:MAG: fibronectin type III domain-containing protein [Phycisphaerales bacterium]|nr:fibronectin type III domain-containing protein [Phycisphaerales bacterium]